MGCGASVEQYACPEVKIEVERRINAAQAKASLEQQVRANITNRNRRAAYANVAQSAEIDITTLTLALARADSDFNAAWGTTRSPQPTHSMGHYPQPRALPAASGTVDSLPPENSSKSLVKTYKRFPWSETAVFGGGHHLEACLLSQCNPTCD